MIQYLKNHIAEITREQKGDPFYLLDLERIRENYHAFDNSAKTNYPQFQIAYSCKTNYTPQLLKYYFELGAFLEVVSEMEYTILEKLNIPYEMIVVNGPLHSQEFVERAIRNGSIFNVDSFYILGFVLHYASSQEGKKLNIGLRLNFDSAFSSRFGFGVDTDEFKELINKLKQHSNINIISLHCHYCEGARSEESYTLRSEKVIDIKETLFQEHSVKYLNVGGGFYSNMPSELKAQFAQKIPTIKEYADAITEPFRKYYQSAQDKPFIMVEPGALLVSDTKYFICKVIDKKVKGKGFMVQTNGCIYDIKPTKSKKNLPLTILQKDIIEDDSLINSDTLTDIGGYTCMEDDIMHRDYKGSIGKEDTLVFSNVGAYTNVLKPPFINYSAPIFLVDGDSRKLVKRKGEFDDIFGKYEF